MIDVESQLSVLAREFWMPGSIMCYLMHQFQKCMDLEQRERDLAPPRLFMYMIATMLLERN